MLNRERCLGSCSLPNSTHTLCLQPSFQLMQKSRLEGALTVPQYARRINNVPRLLPDQSDDVDRLFYWC